MPPTGGPEGHKKGVSRRELLRLAGATGAGLALGGGGVSAALAARSVSDAGSSAGIPGTAIPFFERYQAGISTPQQDHLHFAAFDVASDGLTGLRDLLRRWSEAAAVMCAGKSVGTVGETDGNRFLPPEDTGEAFGLPPARLTVTIGLGPTLFDKDGKDRFGLAAKRPAALEEIPPLPRDSLDPGKSSGDLCVQACSDDPQVAFHAVRNLARIGRGAAVMRWSQLGFGRTSSTSKSQETPRNLMGLKDGTNNIKAEEEDLMDRYVWVQKGEGPSWMESGTYLVARRIRILIEVWDRVSLDDQERTIGREKVSGAPLGKEDEFDPVDLEAKSQGGRPLIPTDSHVRLSRGVKREYCAAATRSPTGWTRPAASSTRGSSLSAFSATRAGSSFRSSGASDRTTSSTSTFCITAALSSLVRPAPAKAATSAKHSSRIFSTRRLLQCSS